MRTDPLGPLLPLCCIPDRELVHRDLIPNPTKRASPMVYMYAVFVLLQVARKLVIIESDLERAEERAELSEG